MKQDILKSNLEEVTTIGEFTSYKVGIDAEDMDWIIQILSSNLYSDPIGSLIREYSSNAWDANVEAGRADKPIEVGIKTDPDQGNYWYVTDLGIGLSPDRIDNVYRKFGKSTKRDDNKAIGMLGLGKFSGLSYSNQIYITTRYEGIQYEYIMHKAENIPQIDLLVSLPSDLPSGTTIKVFLKDYSDKRTFIEKTRQQLAFFENVFFSIDDKDHNTYKIVKNTVFTYSGLEDRTLRFKLGPVSYPIDWERVKEVCNYDYSVYFRGIAVNFDIGELAVTPNREAILYNKKTIENIKNKLELFTEEIIKIHDSQVDEYEDIRLFIDSMNKRIITIGDNVFEFPSVLKSLSKKTPLLKNFPYPLNATSVQKLFSNYKSAARIKNSKKVKHTSYDQLPYDFLNIISDTRNTRDGLMLLENLSLDPKRTKYVVDKYGSNYWECIKFKKITLRNTKNKYLQDNLNYYDLLYLENVPKDKWRDRIVKYIDWQKNYIESIPHIVKYDAEIPTKQWLLDNKITKSSIDNIAALRKSEGKILVKYADTSRRYGQACSFINKEVRIKDLFSQRGYIIYGVEDEKERLENLYSFMSKSKMFDVWVVSKIHHKYLKSISNIMEYSEFIKGNNKLFKYYASNIVMKSVYTKYESFLQCSSILKDLNTQDYLEVIRIKEHGSKYYNYKNNGYHNGTKQEELENFIVRTAVDNNYWDVNIKTMSYKFEALGSKYYFLPLLSHNNTLINNNYGVRYNSERIYKAETVEFAVEVSKLKKIRLDTKYYVKQQNEVEDDSN